ncbi:hypothetical protein QFC22_000859 [Naganishia vaughanmartiniae]|uniref:Uncharacterized protein n=1 Tax=Naganishia vaughanmartiniae TaxID=1424756 RepID=A0ACC2XL11_9TREE|nr:hypothetical protein QFC22_000859 [Naganishia vaughanmartiniae]
MLGSAFEAAVSHLMHDANFHCYLASEQDAADFRISADVAIAWFKESQFFERQNPTSFIINVFDKWLKEAAMLEEKQRVLEAGKLMPFHRRSKVANAAHALDSPEKVNEVAAVVYLTETNRQMAALSPAIAGASERPVDPLIQKFMRRFIQTVDVSTKVGDFMQEHHSFSNTNTLL